ncbi:MAG TPA: tetratricopeptide repeat protein, partial [Rhizomicrobium sp.]|nr:tetratricopeptide repeat protein [Rhizomicrobium sp.]
SDPALLKGLGRARMLSGEGAAAEALFVKLKTEDPAAFDADAELDYARALALQGKNDEAVAQYEIVVARYPGEEARARFGLLLESMGQTQRAQALFAEILASVKGAPGYYRSRQKEWTAIAKQRVR